MYSQLFDRAGQGFHLCRGSVHHFLDARHRLFKLHRFIDDGGEAARCGGQLAQAADDLLKTVTGFLGGLAKVAKLLFQFSQTLAVQFCRTCQLFLGQVALVAQQLVGAGDGLNLLADAVVIVKPQGNARLRNFLQTLRLTGQGFEFSTRCLSTFADTALLFGQIAG